MRTHANLVNLNSCLTILLLPDQIHSRKARDSQLSTALLIAELISASVAILLAFLSLYCMKALKDKHIHRSLWKPVFASSYLFVVASLLAILYTFSVDLMSGITGELELFYHFTWLAGLGILTYGVYSYLKMVEKS